MFKILNLGQGDAQREKALVAKPNNLSSVPGMYVMGGVDLHSHPLTNTQVLWMPPTHACTHTQAHIHARVHTCTHMCVQNKEKHSNKSCACLLNKLLGTRSGVSWGSRIICKEEVYVSVLLIKRP